jgi:hypothetical protein
MKCQNDVHENVNAPYHMRDELRMDGKNLWETTCGESWTTSSDMLSEMWIMEKTFIL